MYLWLMWVSAFAVAVWFYFRQLFSTFSKAGVKSIPAVPLFGNMAGVTLRTSHFTELIDKLYFNFPGERFVGRYEYLKPVLFIRDIELVKKVLVKDFEHFVDHRTLLDEHADPLFGRNLFSLKGQEWKEMRSTLSPAFTSSKMRLMVPFMVDVGEQMVKGLKSKIHTSGGRTDVDVKDLCTRYANDVIASCAFGTKVDSTADEDNEFYLMGKQTTTFKLKNLLTFFASSSFPWLTKPLLQGHPSTLWLDALRCEYRCVVSTPGWAAFRKLRNVFSSKIPQCLKTKVFDQCVLPVMTYGTETWSLTMGLIS